MSHHVGPAFAVVPALRGGERADADTACFEQFGVHTELVRLGHVRLEVSEIPLDRASRNGLKIDEAGGAVYRQYVESMR